MPRDSNSNIIAPECGACLELVIRAATLDVAESFLDGSRWSVRLGLRELRTPPGREFRRVEVASLHLEYPDIFATGFVRLPNRGEPGIDHGNRTEIRKPVVICVNDARERGTEQVYVV